MVLVSLMPRRLVALIMPCQSPRLAADAIRYDANTVVCGLDCSSVVRDSDCMLPDFPKQKRHFQSFLGEITRARLQRDPLISMIHIHHMHEGSGIQVRTQEFEDNIELKQVGFEAEIARDDLAREGPSIYIRQALAAAEKFVEAHHKILFEKVNQVTRIAGNVTDTRGKPFSPDVLLDALERIEVDFDEAGNAKLPAMIMHPKLLESIKDKIPEWEQDPEFAKRKEEIIEQKRKDWIDRQNSRLLVD
jgi:hypothetical protein